MLDLVQVYFDRVSDSYESRSGIGLWKLFRFFEARALRSLNRNLNCQNILELGCGAGFYSQWLSTLAPKKLVLVDFSQNMLDQVSIPGAEKICADITALQLKSKFDLILCAGALEFLPKPELVFKSVSQALNDGGEFLLLVPRKSILGFFYQRFHRRHGLEISLFDLDELQKMAASHGLNITGMRTAFPFSLCARVGKS